MTEYVPIQSQAPLVTPLLTLNLIDLFNIPEDMHLVIDSISLQAGSDLSCDFWTDISQLRGKNPQVDLMLDTDFRLALREQLLEQFFAIGASPVSRGVQGVSRARYKTDSAVDGQIITELDWHVWDNMAIYSDQLAGNTCSWSFGYHHEDGPMFTFDDFGQLTGEITQVNIELQPGDLFFQPPPFRQLGGSFPNADLEP